MKDVINGTVLTELSEAFGDDAAVIELIELYLINSRERMVELENARGDQVKKIAHSLRSSSLNVGAEAFAEKLLALEFYSDETLVADLVSQAHDAFQKVEAELNDFRKNVLTKS